MQLFFKYIKRGKGKKYAIWLSFHIKHMTTCSGSLCFAYGITLLPRVICSHSEELHSVLLKRRYPSNEFCFLVNWYCLYHFYIFLFNFFLFLLINVKTTQFSAIFQNRIYSPGVIRLNLIYLICFIFDTFTLLSVSSL